MKLNHLKPKKGRGKMSGDNFVPAIDATELEDGSMKLVNVAGKDILLARIGDQVFGVSNICPCGGVFFQKGK